MSRSRSLPLATKKRLLGYLEGSGKIILPEPHALLTKVPKVPGVDGKKMSKSLGNIIGLREADDAIHKKICSMVTDPARMKRSDPGEPTKCPVWSLHQLYSNDDIKDWAAAGCRSASIGCLDCKKPLIDAICKEISPLRERALEYQRDKPAIRKIITEGNEQARAIAHDTLDEVHHEMSLLYS